MSNFYIAAYWTDRREDAASCGERLARCLGALQNCDSVFEDVYAVLSAGPKASPRVNVDDSALAEIFAQGRNREDAPPRKVIESLGYSASFISKDRAADQKWVMRCSVGMFAGKPGLLNRCVLNLPKTGEAAERLLRLPTATDMLLGTILAWQPEWATVQSSEFRNSVSNTSEIPGPTLIGWMTYFSRGAAVIPNVPVHSRRELPELGTLLTLTEHPVSALSVEDVRLARTLCEQLRRTGQIPA